MKENGPLRALMVEAAGTDPTAPQSDKTAPESHASPDKGGSMVAEGSPEKACDGTWTEQEDGTNAPHAEDVHPGSLPHGWFEFVARRTLRPGLLSEHHQCSALWEMMSGQESTGFVRVEFRERGPERYRSGARKGELRWGGKETERVAIVSRAEMRGVMADWERKTGRCGHCTNGRTLAKWSVAEGSTYRACGHCNGTQRAAVLSDIPGPVEVRECRDCDGSGLAPAGEHPRNGCPFCRGTGAVRVRVRP